MRKKKSGNDKEESFTEEDLKEETSAPATESVQEEPLAENEQREETSAPAAESVQEEPLSENEQLEETSAPAAESVQEEPLSENEQREETSAPAAEIVQEEPLSENEQNKETSAPAAEIVQEELLGKNNQKGDTICDSTKSIYTIKASTRKQVPLKIPDNNTLLFLHHAGVLLLLTYINDITIGLPLTHISRQWLISVLLGAVNIEQSIRLDFSSLEKLVGVKFLRSPQHQRCALKAGSTEYNRILLFRRNSNFVDADNHRWYYYDPHGIRYTGMRKILKGWCGSAGKIGRTYYQDFIHSSSGEPLFFKSYDNYYDLRERFKVTVSEFAQTLKNPCRRIHFVLDRGIYGHDILSSIHQTGDIIITWEKGYNHDGWDSSLPVVHFKLTRYRNNFQDTISCNFSCVRYPFSKISGYDRIIVRAQAENKEDIEVSVLTNGKELSTEETVTAIFTRWIQECDFLYEVRHFGLNQITSYDFEDYGSLKESLIEKSAETNEYISQKLKLKQLNKELRKLLLKKENTMDNGRQLNREDSLLLQTLKQDIDEITEAMKQTERLCLKEEKLIEDNAQKLNTGPKQYMDIIKITARNIFFKLFESFRPLYNNFRNDHTMLRELTHAPGFVSTNAKTTTVFLYPALTIQPKVKQTLQLFLSQISDKIIDSQGKKIEFILCDNDNNGSKKGISICDLQKQNLTST